MMRDAKDIADDVVNKAWTDLEDNPFCSREDLACLIAAAIQAERDRARVDAHNQQFDLVGRLATAEGMLMVVAWGEPIAPHAIENIKAFLAAKEPQP